MLGGLGAGVRALRIFENVAWVNKKHISRRSAISFYIHGGMRPTGAVLDLTIRIRRPTPN